MELLKYEDEWKGDASEALAFAFPSILFRLHHRSVLRHGVSYLQKHILSEPQGKYLISVI